MEWKNVGMIMERLPIPPKDCPMLNKDGTCCALSYVYGRDEYCEGDMCRSYRYCRDKLNKDEERPLEHLLYEEGAIKYSTFVNINPEWIECEYKAVLDDDGYIVSVEKLSKEDREKEIEELRKKQMKKPPCSFSCSGCG